MLDQLPGHVLLDVFKNVDADELVNLELTCCRFYNLVEGCRRQLKNKRVYYIDINTERLRVWHDTTTCDKIPFEDGFESVAKYISFVSADVIQLTKPTEALCQFLIQQCKKFNLRFNHLELQHIADLSYESISQLMVYARCEGLLVGVGGSHMTAEDLELPGLKQAKLLGFEMDQSLNDDTFNATLAAHCKKIFFQQCNNITTSFMNTLFKEWYNNKKEISCLRISTKQDISFDSVFQGLPVEPCEFCTWTMFNKTKDKNALITVRRSVSHFFVSFEVNSRIEDMLYKKPNGVC